jgi:hypothetical protein
MLRERNGVQWGGVNTDALFRQTVYLLPSRSLYVILRLQSLCFRTGDKRHAHALPSKQFPLFTIALRSNPTPKYGRNILDRRTGGEEQMNEEDESRKNRTSLCTKEFIALKYNIF